VDLGESSFFRSAYEGASLRIQPCVRCTSPGPKKSVPSRFPLPRFYEAAVLGIVQLKRSGFAFANVGPATRLKISVALPATIHELSVAKLQAWLDTNGKAPRAQATKITLRQFLGRE
jgi:hypothetical protein